MRKGIENLKKIFLNGSKRAECFLKVGYFIPKSDDSDDKDIVILTMRELKEIAKMFRDLDSRADNLRWRLTTDAEQGIG